MTVSAFTFTFVFNSSLSLFLHISEEAVGVVTAGPPAALLVPVAAAGVVAASEYFEAKPQTRIF